MKKYITYILIITVLIGMFSSVVHAETNKEHCIATEQNAGTTITQANQDCASTANPDATYVEPVGTCTDGANVGQLTQSECSATGGTWSAPYVLLAPLPCNSTTDANCVNGQLTAFDPSSASGDKISGYLNLMIKIFIGLCAVLAVVMIVIGGIEYMTSELVSSKEAGKERIRGAIFGLLLALGAWTLLNQINPDILNTNLSSLQNVTVDVIVGGESSTPFGTGLNSQSLASAKINCSTNLETTANSFIGNSTYSQTYRNTVNPNGTVVVDCSSFVDQVYQCSKLPIPGSTTTEIFDTTKGATKITAQDLQTLKVGDLIGWKKGDTAGQVETDGHVMMYIGNGMIIDAMGGTTNGVTKRLLKDITAARLTYIKRIP